MNFVFHEEQKSLLKFFFNSCFFFDFCLN